MSLSYPEVLALVGFLDQYQRTLLWSETLDDGTSLDSLDIEVVIHESAYLTLIDDCLKFLRDLFQSPDPAIVQFRLYRNLEQEDGSDNPDNRTVWKSMAHDLVLSRNGHGCPMDCQPWSRKSAESFVFGIGQAPSLVYDSDHGVRTGVQALGEGDSLEGK